MKTYHGSCHCGAVRFEIQSDLKKIVKCNCSICTKKGALLHRVPPENFSLLSGEENLELYQFNKKIAKHYFCKTCGMQTFARPRAAPELYTVNVRCLDDFDLEAHSEAFIHFDGKNYEQAVATLKSL